ncbi:MAG: TetR/AcrR family transcriptional regulator [Labilithrix sp.]|nr:TetR/AcrR family transcriptional regulator [Labilithrix sp.]
MAKKPRIRRTPEEARTHILDAADRVFAEHLPDVVGLKEIAREAGVSHALVTHYFKTYDGLVEAALERRIVRLRDALIVELAPAFTSERPPSTKDLLAAYRRTIGMNAADPVTTRLMIWAMMGGRAKHGSFFVHRLQGLKLLADALEKSSPTASREDLEFCIVASMAITTVWRLGAPMLSGALGRHDSPPFEGTFEERTAEMIDAYLDARARRKRRA